MMIRIMIHKKKIVRKKQPGFNPDYLAIYIKAESGYFSEVCGIASVPKATTPKEFADRDFKAKNIASVFVNAKGTLSLEKH